MTRCLAGHITIDGVDDEWFTSNEYGHSEALVNMYLDPGAPAAALQIPPLRWGGECRVELELYARVAEGNQVHVNGEARLYEGDSENTTDLEDRRTIDFLVPRNTKAIAPTDNYIHLVNSGWGGGDYADIRIVLTNTLVEE